ncbi:hypothetical protein WJX73_009037 [Symbiochloris irregularis]|uniref:SnoaL-like domain-containing protein n=1 Tax=Symbiochloris irregularis TaxID=706552 RepID=A0AAW1PQJ8_9CHLO
MVYQEPFVGKDAIRGYFTKVSNIIPGDLKFHLDEITSGDPHFVGVKWHVDLAGNEFPFSRGCSFYEVDDQGKIRAARDLVEQAVKPGSSALYALKLLTPLIRKLGPKANPANLNNIPTNAILVWGFYAVYLWYIFFSKLAPGAPGITPPPGTFTELYHESINYFYINIFLHWANLPGIPTNAEHPVSEALFNFVNAYSLMLWPLMAADMKSIKIKGKFWWWVGTQFITNVVFLPFMAIREQPAGSFGTLTQSQTDARLAELTAEGPEGDLRMPYYAPAMGAVAAVIGLVSIAWAVVGRPEFGGMPERWDFFVSSFTGNRVFYAFFLDLAFYTTWQIIFMRRAEGKYRFVPFAGLAAWLIVGGPSKRT